LAAFNRVSTDSVDDAADAVGRIFCPHELKPTTRSSPEFFALQCGLRRLLDQLRRLWRLGID